MTGSILHQSSWCRTVLGTNVEMHALASVDPLVLFIGGVHGDEPEGVFLAQQLLRWLQKNHNQVPFSWALIPCLNPDGFQSGKRTNSAGVDLNRNFPSPDWSGECKSERYFPGPHANSENEIQALTLWLQQRKPNLIVHFHSWQPCVVYTGAPGKTAAQILAGSTGFPVREDIGYPTPGSLGQYGWQVLKTPVVCIESPEKMDDDQVWSLFGPGLIRLLTSELPR